MTAGWVWVIIGAIVALLALWNPIKTFLVGMWQGFKSTFEDIRNEFDGLKDALFELWDAFAPVGSAVRELADDILDVGRTILNLFGDWTEEGKSFGEEIGDAIVANIRFFTMLAKAIKPIFEIIGGALSSTLNDLRIFIEITKAALGLLADLTTSTRGWVGRKLFGRDGNDDSGQQEEQQPQQEEENQPVSGGGFRRGGVAHIPSQSQFNIPGFDPSPIFQVANGAYASGMYHARAILPPQTNTQSRSTSINIDRIEITTPDGDPETIAASVGDRLNNMLHNTAEDFDDDFAR